MNDNFYEKFKIKDLKVFDFNYWLLSVRPQQPTLGSMLISLKRPCNNLGLLLKEEAQELSSVFFKTERLLKAVFKYDKINYLCLMMVDNQVHFHVIPRYLSSVKFNNKNYTDVAWPGPPDISKNIADCDLVDNLYTLMKQMAQPANQIIGYTTGVFDLFHIGHLNILKAAKENCDYLIVGVSTDELSMEQKYKKPIMPLIERLQIVKEVRYVDEVVQQTTMDKIEAWRKYKFHKMFVGSDWKGNEKWNILEEEFHKFGVEIVYFPYTQTTSSTLIRKALNKL